MRAAINGGGYFTQRPYWDPSAIGGGSIYMRQYGRGGRSEIEIYKLSFGSTAKDFGRAVFHELVHATSWQHRVMGLDNTPPDPNYAPSGADPIHDPDPATHYRARLSYTGYARVGQRFNLPNSYNVPTMYEGGPSTAMPT